MTYLVDTNVWSELRNRGRSDSNVRAWAQGVREAELYLSVVTVLELERGVLPIERRDGRQGVRLRAWLERHVLAPFERQILSIDVSIARRCAAFHVPDPRPKRDALIAATALAHGLTVVTRNTVDFEPMGVSLLNPWLPLSTEAAPNRLRCCGEPTRRRRKVDRSSSRNNIAC